MKFQNPSFKFFLNGRTDKTKAICSPLFQSWGHKKVFFLCPNKLEAVISNDSDHSGKGAQAYRINRSESYASIQFGHGCSMDAETRGDKTYVRVHINANGSKRTRVSELFSLDGRSFHLRNSITIYFS